MVPLSGSWIIFCDFGDGSVSWEMSLVFIEIYRHAALISEYQIGPWYHTTATTVQKMKDDAAEFQLLATGKRTCSTAKRF